MTLVSFCDYCNSDWIVDALVYIECMEAHLCPCCVNELVEDLKRELQDVARNVQT